MTTYATAAELRSYVKKIATSDDTILGPILDAASNTIDRFCNRPDGFVAAAATARLFSGEGAYIQRIDECISVTLVEVKDSPTDTTYRTWTVNDWILFAGHPNYPNLNAPPFNQLMVSGIGTFQLFTSGRIVAPRGFRWDEPIAVERNLPTVRVTAAWGYASAVPPGVKMATIAQAARWYKRGEGTWADALANPEMGTLLFKRALDPDIQMMLQEARLVRPATGRR